MRRSGFTFALWAALVAAGLLRGAALFERPLHADEANQAYRTARLAESGVYRFDPQEHHGPTLYYAGAAAMRLFGVRSLAGSEAWIFRAVPFTAGLLTLLLLSVFARELGLMSTGCGLILLALSPFQTYFGAYFIQEPLLLLFSAGALAAACQWGRTGQARWLVALSLSLGCLMATKETCVLLFAAAAAGALWAGRDAKAAGERPPPRIPSLRALAGISAGAAAWAALCYASFGVNLGGPFDALASLVHFAGKGAAPEVHRHPWFYYLGLLAWPRPALGSPAWSEGLILGLGLLGSWRAVRPGASSLLRFLAGFGLAGALIYSLIPYKTPWNFLVPYTAWTLVAGAGAAWLLHRTPPRGLRTLAAAGLLLGMAHLGWQSWLVGRAYPADPRNPYAYSAASPALARLPQLLDAKGDRSRLRIAVIAPGGDYWPLPWTLRRFENVGYFEEIPERLETDAVIVPSPLSPKLPRSIRRTFTHHYSALRPGALLSVWLRP